MRALDIRDQPAVGSDGRLWRPREAIADHRPMPERRIRKWSHVAWNNSRAGSLDSTALGGVERKEHPTGTRPSIGSSNKRPQLPAGAVSFESVASQFEISAFCFL